MTSNAFLPTCCLVVLFSCFCGTALTLAAEPLAPRFEVQIVRDVQYRNLYEGEDPDRNKDKLDLFVPKNLKEYPVLFFVHGGAWMRGDKNFFGVYSALGIALAKQGIGVVVPNYRLSPGVKHPEHVRDVATAFAWTYHNIARYGGRPDQIFVGGHSAGGHLSALLATDERWLKEVGLTLAAIKGAIPMSGVYHIPDKLPLFDPIFGEDAGVRHDASPVFHARSGLPPFLLIYADDDLRLCDKPFAEELGRALRAAKVETDVLEIPNRNHITVLFKALLDGDPVGVAIRAFIRKHAPLQVTKSKPAADS